MRDTVIDLYIFMLRTAGAYAGAFSVMFFATLGGQIEAGHAILLPAFGNLLALAMAIVIAVPPLSPERLTPTAGEGEWISLILPLGVLPFLFVLPSWTAVAGLGLGPEMTRTLAQFASAPVLIVSGLAWLIAVGLHFWRAEPASEGAATIAAE